MINTKLYTNSLRTSQVQKKMAKVDEINQKMKDLKNKINSTKTQISEALKICNDTICPKDKYNNN